jgi:hypothetical protein
VEGIQKFLVDDFWQYSYRETLKVRGYGKKVFGDEAVSKNGFSTFKHINHIYNEYLF